MWWTLLLYFSLTSFAGLEPKGHCDQFVEQKHYLVCYSQKHRQAFWTFHLLTKRELRGKQKRTNDFRRDPEVQFPVSPKDYTGSGFDRGHLVPAADRVQSRTAMSETFYMSNISPQTPALNRRVWKRLESHIRKLVQSWGEAYVVTGPILKGHLEALHSGISIPDYFFKLAYFPEKGRMVAFLAPNADHFGHSQFEMYQVTVNQVEKKTGYDFYADLPNSLERKLESEL